MRVCVGFPGLNGCLYRYIHMLLSVMYLLIQAHVLLGQFIKPQSPLEVNMPDTLRAEMADGVASGVVPPDALKKLKEAAFLDMMRDTMPRFLKDELYTEACLAESSDLVHVSRKHTDVALVRMGMTMSIHTYTHIHTYMHTHTHTHTFIHPRCLACQNMILSPSSPTTVCLCC